MTAHYEKYIQILAEAFKQQYAGMSRKQTESYVVKASRELAADDYMVGAAVSYRIPRKKINGQFIIGLTARNKAIQLAAAIARHKGLPAVSELDTGSLNCLNDFLNEGLRRAVAGWDHLGLSVDTGSLSSLVDMDDPDAILENARETYMLTLRVSGEPLSIFVTLRELAPNVLSGKKVLVADDSRMIRTILGRAFKKQGCQVIEAVDGRNAIEKFRERQPDLIIMDMVMPQMDGLEAVGKIRQIDPQVKVLMLTSLAGKKEVMAAASLGISGYVKKPVKPEKLIETAAGCFT